MEKSYGVIDTNAAAAPGISSKDASFCENNTLDHTFIKGKIVVCKLAGSFQRIFVQQAGAVGIIVIGPLATDNDIMSNIPSILIGRNETEELKAYLKTKRDPITNILSTTTVLNTRPVPKMAEFSSMGPNIITPDIIKVATVLDNTGRPILKDPNGSPTTPFDYGSGHVNPVAALDPGLISDFDSNDIIKFLYGNGARPEQLSLGRQNGTMLDNTRRQDPNGSSTTTPFDYACNPVKEISLRLDFGVPNPGPRSWGKPMGEDSKNSTDTDSSSSNPFENPNPSDEGASSPEAEPNQENPAEVVLVPSYRAQNADCHLFD
ncbi:hypothetical protein HHK36_017947 [Tetracentron sinense]|uniref:PA domain-containing protein n=1 Tax=Tetracentron sinense TaxID=13715 RepID=A0A835DAU1_TETSI|nr:hypothetical protein HHK36_017947 [Tetracentron sinense]